MAELASYRALKRGFTDHVIEPGVVFDFDGVPGSWMEPLNVSAKKAFDKMQADRRERKKNPDAFLASDEMLTRPDPAPRLIKSHPKLPYPPTGGDEDPAARGEISERTRQVRAAARRGAKPPKAKKGGKGVKPKAGDRSPPQPQSTPIKSPEQQ